MTTSAKIVPVLRYRHITPNGGDFNCLPTYFDEQMEHLAYQGFTTLSATEFASFLNGGEVPAKSVFITFDGGFLDNYVFAYPILKKYILKASVFLSTSFIKEGIVRSTYESGEILPFCPPHDECKRRIYAGHPETVMMNWDEVRYLKSSGIFDFHSLGYTQTRWEQQVNEEGKNMAMTKELEMSRAILQQELGEVSEHFCWPNGYFDEDYITLAKEAGFHYLYTTDFMGENYPHMDSTHIYRIDAPNKGGFFFSYRLWLARHPKIGHIYNRYALKRLAK
ncbi:polysaccharide deacetylase family protein [Pelistega sp. NLN82]|uniref:Polysaccharide deacetylase family protein n=1 Tax=Pelistega ratti TaxID=2652177 RepID=A0A6L9Y5P8_9BURK|nr:polysaccharide deacetylase family protein [Pelistega ratti]NEN75673.1 polysaccharide deacetylase family protein [Pelistega ratti]